MKVKIKESSEFGQLLKNLDSAVAISMVKAVGPNIMYAFDHFHETDNTQMSDTEILQLKRILFSGSYYFSLFRNFL